MIRVISLDSIVILFSAEQLLTSCLLESFFLFPQDFQSCRDAITSFISLHPHHLTRSYCCIYIASDHEFNNTCAIPICDFCSIDSLPPSCIFRARETITLTRSPRTPSLPHIVSNITCSICSRSRSCSSSSRGRTCGYLRHLWYLGSHCRSQCTCHLV